MAKLMHLNKGKGEREQQHARRIQQMHFRSNASFAGSRALCVGGRQLG